MNQALSMLDDEELDAEERPLVEVDEESAALCARVWRHYERRARERAAIDGAIAQAPEDPRFFAWTTLDQIELETWGARVVLVDKTSGARFGPPRRSPLAGGGPEEGRLFFARAREPPRATRAPEVASKVCEAPDSIGGAGASQAIDVSTTAENEKGSAMKGNGVSLTEKERAIVDAHAVDPSPTAIAERLGMTRANVDTRLWWLRKKGAIGGGRAKTTKGKKTAPRASAPADRAARVAEAPAVEADPLVEQLRARRADLISAHVAKLARIDAALAALTGEA